MHDRGVVLKENTPKHTHTHTHTQIHSYIYPHKIVCRPDGSHVSIATYNYARMHTHTYMQTHIILCAHTHNINAACDTMYMLHHLCCGVTYLAMNIPLLIAMLYPVPTLATFCHTCLLTYIASLHSGHT